MTTTAGTTPAPAAPRPRTPGDHLVRRAAVAGSAATTSRGALRYLLAHWKVRPGLRGRTQVPSWREDGTWGLPTAAATRRCRWLERISARAAARAAAEGLWARDHAEELAAGLTTAWRQEMEARADAAAASLRLPTRAAWADRLRARARALLRQVAGGVDAAAASLRLLPQQAYLGGCRTTVWYESDLLEALAALEEGYRLRREGTRLVLTGVDDGHPFQVPVPGTCATVAQALEWLRPPDVPEGAPRQGEYFFVPAALPGEGSSAPTRAGSWRETEHEVGATFSRSHHAEECVRVVTQGETAFVGRRQHVRTHEWRGRDRYFARGEVTHSRGEHPPLDLGARWHEVVPNRAHGPWPVRRQPTDLD